MSCPGPGHDGAQCQWSATGHCRRPNAWIQHLIRYGQQGYSFQQLRGMYVPGGAAAVKCRNVRRNGKNRNPDAGANPYQFFMNQPAWNIPPTYMINRALYFLKHHVFEGRVNWDHGDFITPERVQGLFRVVDRYVCGGALTRELQTQGHTLTLESDDEEDIQHAAWCRSGVGLIPNQHEIVFFQEFWRADRWPRMVSGLRMRHMLHAALLIMMHEVVHLIIHIWGPVNTPDHGAEFLHIFRCFCGASGAFFQNDDNHVIIPVD